MSGRSRSRSRNVSSTNDRSRSGRSKSRSRRAADSKSDKGRNRNGNRRRNASPVGPSFQTYFDEPSFQNYFDEAVKSATTKAIEIFEKRDDDDQFDDDTDFSDEFSFATPESTYSDRGGGKSSANNHSKKVAAVSTEAEKKTQPDIATFRLKKNGRPRVVRNLVKQLKRDEEKYQKAARALQEAEENMWKTKWRLYNLAEDFGLLCGNFDANVVEKKKEENKMIVHDNVYNDDDYDDESSEYSYDR